MTAAPTAVPEVLSETFFVSVKTPSATITDPYQSVQEAKAAAAAARSKGNVARVWAVRQFRHQVWTVEEAS